MRFRGYEKDQSVLFGVTPDSMIPEKHLVRFISQTIDELDHTRLYNAYSDEGCPAYDPVMMLKIVVYSYMNGIYTCRKIAKAVRENINLIWLANFNTPDFRTINTFCWTRCKDLLVDYFCQVVIKAEELGYLDYDNCFVDGSTFRANAGKTSYIWKKNSLRYQQQVKVRVGKVFERIHQQVIEEQLLYGESDLKEMGTDLNSDIDLDSSESIIQKLKSEEKRLTILVDKLKKAKPLDKGIQKKLQGLIKDLKKAKKEEVPKLQKYEEQLEIIGQDRKSASKTDHDATFIRMKNGELAPGYTVSISTSEQFVTGVHVYNNNRESNEFTNLVDDLNVNYGRLPVNFIADAVYGTASNLDYLKQKGMNSYLKSLDYKIDYRETTLTDLIYDEANDEWICKKGKRFVFRKSKIVETNGPKREVRSYICKDCGECPEAKKCIRRRDKTVRYITYDPHITPIRKENYENLRSDAGKQYSKKRCIEPEAVFGFVKWNKQFNRFTVRTLQKCKTQLLMVLLGHNIGKMYLHSSKLATST